MSCSQEYVVPVETVDAHIKFLSSDEMNGRHPFGKEIKIAEKYIIDQYKKHGLKALPQFPEFKHEFVMTRTKLAESLVKFNGKEANSYYLVTNMSRNLTNVKAAEFDLHDFSSEKKLPVRKIFGMLRSKEQAKSIIYLSKSQMESLKKNERYIPLNSTTIGEKKDRLILIAEKSKRVKTISIQASVDDEKHTLTNTIAYLEGSELKDEYVLFGAHHDHLAPSTNPDQEDKIYNGADDDASGTTGVLTLAEYFAKNAGNKRSIIFSTFTAEEMGIIGSRELAANIGIDAEKIKAALCMELLGGMARGGDGNAILTGYEYSDLGEIMQAAADTANFNLMADPYKGMNLFYRSDNISFARHGIPAHTVSVTDFTVKGNTYHNVADDYSTMRVPNMQAIIMGIARSMAPVISGQKTPSRIDKTKIR
jgi:hypothetical protein